ncbi:MAG TPA: HNH endonuclease [Nocardioidaceae bacterium]|nr:HNH endonuclease [Nocardioidaceae bacterium]
MTAAHRTPPCDTAVLRGLVASLSSVSASDDTDRVDLLRVLEELKCAAAGVQARVTVEFAASQRAAQEAAGVPARRVGLGVAAQVALARRESPHRGQQHLGLAHALVEMPYTADALSRGRITEWRATILARETACLSRADRATVDAEVAAIPGGLEALGDRATQAAARRVAYRLDPYAFTRRAAKAESERTVTLRPAPDTMTHLTGLLPVRGGVAVYAALTRHADTLRCAGDARTRGQIMADTLVERVTGQATATAVPVEVNLVMTDSALLHGDPTPAHVPGYGPVPAPLARQWLAGGGAGTGCPDQDAGLDEETRVFLRRLYTAPDHTTLVAMDTTRRHFTGGLRKLIGLRDQHCRTPWCDAPIRHIDHPQRHTDGGPTTATNSQSLCEACNHAKEAPGWSARPDPHGGHDHAIGTTTPTGHHYRSRPPPLTAPRATAPPARPRLDLHYADVALIA